MSDLTTNEEYDQGFSIGYKAGRKRGYVKGRIEAIDEYKQKILSTCSRECLKCNFCKDETCDIAYLAEQLKEGNDGKR